MKPIITITSLPLQSHRAPSHCQAANGFQVVSSALLDSPVGIDAHIAGRAGQLASAAKPAHGFSWQSDVARGARTWLAMYYLS